jgi:prefoldin subunit 5
LGKAITDNVESLNKAYSFIESLVAEIKQNYDQAVLAYGNAVDVAHRTNESAEKAISATNKSLAFVEETNTKIGSVLDILTERQENLECLTKQIVSTNATIESLQKLESTLNKLVNK